MFWGETGVPRLHDLVHDVWDSFSPSELLDHDLLRPEFCTPVRGGTRHHVGTTSKSQGLGVSYYVRRPDRIGHGERCLLLWFRFSPVFRSASSSILSLGSEDCGSRYRKGVLQGTGQEKKVIDGSSHPTRSELLGFDWKQSRVEGFHTLRGSMRPHHCSRDRPGLDKGTTPPETGTSGSVRQSISSSPSGLRPWTPSRVLFRKEGKGLP